MKTATKKIYRRLPHKRRTIGTLKSYNFKDRDPVFDDMRTKWRESGLTIPELAYVTDISESTLHAWLTRCTTRRTFNDYVEAFYRAVGYMRRGYTVAGGKVLDFPRQRRATAERQRRRA